MAEVHEDEEQKIKFSETINLLLAAGYFRARIKGLSPFDKVVGGMTWCITTCSYALNVDILFQENSSIGQKIALTEKIVAVLPKMKCPHQIEPHQIQGLDFIHIFPVIQWLVKKAIETREETGDFVRSYSISQFDKEFQLPQDTENTKNMETVAETLKEIKKEYQPLRKYKNKQSVEHEKKSVRVMLTLLEYGKVVGTDPGKGIEESEEIDVNSSTGAKNQAQEHSNKDLMKNFKEMSVKATKLSSSAVGSLFDVQSSEIRSISEVYSKRREEMFQTGAHLGGLQNMNSLLVTLKKQIEKKTNDILNAQQEHEQISQNFLMSKSQYEQEADNLNQLEHKLDNMKKIKSCDDESVLETLKSLVQKNEEIKSRENESKEKYKEEIQKLKAKIEEAKNSSKESDFKDRVNSVTHQYTSEKEKYDKLRLLIAGKIRKIGKLQRKIDEVPTRNELAQYQKRFIELYNNVASTHKETKQFYTFYNTLDDKRLFLNKEIALLNSIYDNYTQALSSTSNREQFMKQMNQIVVGVEQNRKKLEKKKQDEKMRRDQMNDEYLDLVEKQRLYFKIIKDLNEEMKKNEILISKLNELSV